MEINWSPDTQTLKQFGLASLFGFAGFAAVAHWGWHLPALSGALALAGAATWMLSIIHAPAVKFVYLSLTIMAYPIGFAVTHMVLAGVYFVMLMPIGLLFKLIGRDALRRRLDSRATTYWQARPTPADPARYFRQF